MWQGSNPSCCASSLSFLSLPPLWYTILWCSHISHPSDTSITRYCWWVCDRTAVCVTSHAISHPVFLSVLFSPLPTDIIEALNHQLDAQWQFFGTFLHVDYPITEAIKKDNGGNSGDCMLHLLGKWTSNQAGTGSLPRTWQTIVDAVKRTGSGVIAENLALKHGVNLLH